MPPNIVSFWDLWTRQINKLECRETGLHNSYVELRLETNLCALYQRQQLDSSDLSGEGGGVLPEKPGGCVRPLPKTLTLFMTKIWDISYATCIFDLTNYSKPYLWLNPSIKTLTQTC